MPKARNLLALILFVLVACESPFAVGQVMCSSSEQLPAPGDLPARIFEKEKQIIALSASYSAGVSIHLQFLKGNFFAPVFGRRIYDKAARVDLSRIDQSLNAQKLSTVGRFWSKLSYGGFVSAAFLDASNFDSKNYFLKSLGIDKERFPGCYLFSVTPLRTRGGVFYRGCIWVTPADFTIIAFEGQYKPSTTRTFFLAEDHWFHVYCLREEVLPGVWLPAKVTVENPAPNLDLFFPVFKAETNFKDFRPGSTTPRRSAFSEILP